MKKIRCAMCLGTVRVRMMTSMDSLRDVRPHARSQLLLYLKFLFHRTKMDRCDGGHIHIIIQHRSLLLLLKVMLLIAHNLNSSCSVILA